MSQDLLEGKKIVLIEDNEFLSNVIVTKLKTAGAEVFAYKNGLEGLAAIRQHKPDLVLLDIMLPIMNGYEVLQVMATEGLVQKHPVMVVSNSGQPVELKRVLQLGAKDYLVKADFTPDEVLDKARAILQTANTVTQVQTKMASPVTHQDTAKIFDMEDTVPAIKVFVVEDDPMLRNLLSVKFSASRLTYMFINDGAQALELARDYEPDIIVLDLMLPGMDGFEILGLIKKDEQLKNIPVIVFTNKSEPKDVKTVLDLGATSCHIKALTNLNDFVEEIRSSVR